MARNRGKSFVTIMIAIALTALLLRVAIEQFINISITQNEASATGTLKLISVALENFAKNNKGVYPSNLGVLTQARPTYLDKNYVSVSPYKGYMYSCPKLDATGYICTALPYKCGLTGKTDFSISTGSLFVSEGCEKKE